MKLALDIFKTKAELTAAIKASKSFSIDLNGVGNFFISFDEDGDISNLVRTDEDETEHDYEHHGTFFAALWKEIKNYAHISILWIDGERQDLIKMENDVNIKEAKKKLNKTQIKDRTIGMVSVTNALHSKMVISEDDNLIDLARAFQNILTDYNGAKAYGRLQNCSRGMKQNIKEMQEVLKKLDKSFNSFPKNK